MKQFFTITTLILMLTACDTNHRIFRDGKDGTSGQAGSSCSVTQTPTGAVINCQDGSTATITNGQVGARGLDGSSCSVSPAVDNSGALISCQDGSNVFVSNGQKGDTGSPGMNATSVEMVKLCPGAVENYGSFPEYAMRVGNKLYGVYSVGSGFLAQLYPGQYVTSSNGPNCNFTVNSDGTVSN